MALLSREEILQADDIAFEDVEVPEWGGSVRVRTLTGTERDAFEVSIVSTNGKSTSVNMQNARAKLCAMCIVDEQGHRLFTDRDVAALGEKSARALDRVFGVAQRLNGLSADDIEVLVKN